MTSILLIPIGMFTLLPVAGPAGQHCPWPELTSATRSQLAPQGHWGQRCSQLLPARQGPWRMGSASPRGCLGAVQPHWSGGWAQRRDVICLPQGDAICLPSGNVIRLLRRDVIHLLQRDVIHPCPSGSPSMAPVPAVWGDNWRLQCIVPIEQVLQ